MTRKAAPEQERQIKAMRRIARRLGLRIHKHYSAFYGRDGYMITYLENDFIIDGADPFPFSLSFEEMQNRILEMAKAEKAEAHVDYASSSIGQEEFRVLLSRLSDSQLEQFIDFMRSLSEVGSCEQPA